MQTKKSSLSCQLLGLVALFALLLPCSARVGETPQECVVRYGKPKEVDKKALELIFRKGPYAILTVFDQGKCVFISFLKMEPNDAGSQLTAVEIETLLDANIGKSQWSSYGDGEYRSGDGKIVARKSGVRLDIGTADAWKRKLYGTALEDLKGF